MTELNFKGKEFVYNHHLAVPFRPLVPDETKGIGPVALDGNLVVHGDNLHALKALLPLYAGKVDCIFRSLRDLCGWLGIGSCEHGTRCCGVG